MQVKLTARQAEILQLVAKGLLNKEIAERLIITEPAVKNHLRAIFVALGADNRAHAVARGYDCGYLRVNRLERRQIPDYLEHLASEIREVLQES